VHPWRPVLDALLALVRAQGFDEALKWGAPCFLAGGRNVALVSALTDHCVLSFPDGARLDDPAGLLERAGPNSRVGRVVRFRSVAEVATHAHALTALLQQAAANARSGPARSEPPAPDPVPPELAARLDANVTLAAAWHALTPGRRRSHCLHVAGAVQAATRARRAEACEADILVGKGWRER
jgi:uncharacterized protein YdeI (YjbR/CyaY-like superfamily)